MHNLIAEPSLNHVRAELDEELRRQMERYRDKLLDSESFLEELGIREVYRRRTEHLYSGRNMSGAWPGREPKR